MTTTTQHTTTTGTSHNTPTTPATPTTPLKLAVITGSVRRGRFGPVVVDWFARQAKEHAGFEVEVVDLATVDLPLALPEVPPAMNPKPERPEGMLPLTRALENADAVVVVTPDYNRSIPGALKQAIDWHFTQWQRKAIGFVGYSGASGGLLAIEHLRQIFGELGAHTVRDYVSFPRYYEHFTADGGWVAPEAAAGAAGALLDELVWWGEALRTARAGV